MKRRRAFALTMIMLLSVLSTAPVFSCDEATQLYNQATGHEDLKSKEDLYKRALAASCTDPSVRAKIHNNLGDTYEKMGRTEEALAQYHQAIALDPDLSTPYFGIGDIYSQTGQPDKARFWHDRGFVLSMQKSKDEIVNALDPKRTLRSIMVKPVDTPLQLSQGAASAPGKPPLIPEVVLYFGFDQATLTPEASRQLQHLQDALKEDELAGYRFRIAGHTCTLGPDEYNQGLSEKRANEVKKWLVAHGISGDRLVAHGYGKTRPIADNSKEDTRRYNRRVEIRTIGVATIASRRGGSGGSNEGDNLRKEGERLLTEERYREAASAFEKALNSYESKGHQQGVRDALNDLLLVSLYLNDAEKANFYSKKLENLK